MIVRHLRIPALIAALGLCAEAAFAQTYPSKMITMVVPWPAGGATDVTGRLIANELRISLGQNVIVENTAGSGGSLGTVKALNAPADGHTLLVSSQQDVRAFDLMGPVKRHGYPHWLPYEGAGRENRELPMV